VNDRQPADVPQSPWHWVTAAAGFVLLVATVAFLVYDGFVRRRTPHPVLSVAVDTVVATPGGHVVRVRVRNDGGIAVSNVRVQGALHGAARSATEEAETSVDYVPPASARDAGLVFEGDPRLGRLDVRVTAFDIP
jgi:uncharacterized protein (TIGR02588 family)